MEKIKFDELITCCNDFITNPSEENMAKLDDVKEKMVIKSMLPIKSKEILLSVLYKDIKSYGSDPYGFAVGIEIYTLFDVLLGYVANLNIGEIDDVYKDYEIYDVITMSGLSDYILSFCEKDYNVMLRMIDRTFSADNINDLLENLTFASPKEINKLIEEFNDFKTNTDPELIKNLSDIVSSHNGVVGEIVKSIEESALGELNNKK